MTEPNHSKRHLHERFAPWGWLRRKLRGAYFGLLKAALATDEGRELLHNAMIGRPMPCGQDELPPVEQPYRDLPVAGGQLDDAGEPGPIFLTGRFRGGTTLLWNLFRQAGPFTAYYEPLCERRWFDPAVRGNWLDQTHLGINDYWSEYDGLASLGEVFNDRWHDRHLWMDRHFADPRLQRYLTALIEHAPNRAVLQFNRVDFRLPWLRQNFPHAKLIHIYRHPRDQWISTMGSVDCSVTQLTLDDYLEKDGFYLRPWLADLKYRYAFLDPQAQANRPYLLYYLVWKLSYQWGRCYADHSLSVESLWSDPLEQLSRLFHSVQCYDVDIESLRPLVIPQQQGKWRGRAEEQWFVEQELAAEQILARQGDSLLPRPGAVDASPRTAAAELNI